jgi:ABC-2 type transport system ATP-binding protein
VAVAGDPAGVGVVAPRPRRPAAVDGCAGAPPGEDPPPAREPAITVRGVQRRHGSGEHAVHAVRGVDLDVRPGEIFGLLGPNGAGKTTLVRLVTGLLRPDAGSVSVFGHDIVRSPQLAPRLLAVLPQEQPALDEVTVALAVETTARLRGLGRRAARAARDDVLTELQLEPLASRVVGQLSGGERRLAGVATALVGDRPLLVLDEPTTGLDPQARRAVWAALERRRRTAAVSVLLVTHNVLEAETVLDRVAVLQAGRVVACDTPGALKAAAGSEVRLDLSWRQDPWEPDGDPGLQALYRGLGDRVQRTGRRWRLRLPADEARALLADLTGGPAFALLDDFVLATASLEDVYVSLEQTPPSGGRP